MNNPYTAYYIDQVGGLSGFSGVRYQRGHGFFGRIFSGIGGFLKDLLPNLGKRALPSAISLAQDVLAGENVRKAAKSRLVEAGRNVADEALTSINSRIQKGSGISGKNIRKSNMFIHGYAAKKPKKANKRSKSKKSKNKKRRR